MARELAKPVHAPERYGSITPWRHVGKKWSRGPRRTERKTKIISHDSDMDSKGADAHAGPSTSMSVAHMLRLAVTLEFFSGGVRSSHQGSDQEENGKAE